MEKEKRAIQRTRIKAALSKAGWDRAKITSQANKEHAQKGPSGTIEKELPENLILNYPAIFFDPNTGLTRFVDDQIKI